MTETPRTRSNQRTAGRPARQHDRPHDRGHIRRRIAATALLLLALLTLPWGGQVAHAHASLLESDPANGSALDTAPEAVRLTFNEDIELLETTRMSGPGGEIAYTADVDGGLVTLRPEQTLTDGRWDVVWQIVSADGHLVGGVLTFTIGTATTGGLPGTTPEATAYTGTGTATNPAETGAPGALDRILELLGWLALIAALGTLIAGKRTPATWFGAGAVLVPALRIIDSVDRWGGNAWIIGETRAALAATSAGVLLLAAALVRGRTSTILGVLGILAWSAQAFLSGHPNVLEPKPLYAALSALHLAGALTWSAAVLAVTIDPVRGRHASRVATIGITLLLPGAFLLAVAFLPDAFEYGAGRWEGILAAKALLVLGALTLGWRNHREVRHLDVDGTPPRHLRRRATVEIGLIALVAILSASLTASIPSRLLHGQSADTAALVTTGATSVNETVDTTGTGSPDDGSPGDGARADTAGERIQLNATLLFENGETGELLFEIAADGSTTLHLVLRDALGSPFTAEQVEYELENPDLGIAGITGPLPVSGTMHMGDTVLPDGGAWRVSVTATYDTFTTVTASADLQVPDRAS
jgi:copper transport protein